VHSVSPRQNRSRIEIIAAILEKAAQGAKKTQMMYGANLSFYQIEGYISYMIKKGFLSFEKESRLYLTTGKGREFLKSYENIKLLMNPPQFPSVKPIMVR
jgi:predicted transcriptional regulator